MEKVFILKGLDCPNCSAKIEREAAKIKGVEDSTVNLMKQSLTINGDLPEDIFNIVTDLVHKYEPEVEVFESNVDIIGKNLSTEHKHSYDKTILRLIIGGILFLVGMLNFKNISTNINMIVLIAAYIVLGYDVILSAVKNILSGRLFDENFLMSFSTVGAFLIGEYKEAVAVMLFYQIGEYFENAAVRNSRKSISDLMDIRPDFANVIRNDSTITVSPDTVELGEIILVKLGEKIPLDGTVTDGNSTLDMAALTGESRPVSVYKGSDVLSGAINQSGVLKIEVKKTFGESTASRILKLVENASEKKAVAENFITSFAKYYTPIVVILAALLAIVPPIVLSGAWTEWIRRSFVFLVISCPCALVVSIPLTFFGGIGAASKKGVLVKGGNYLEALNNIDTVVFDKTGTLTKGVFKVTEVICENDFSKSDLLKYAAFAERFSNHPIAKSILATTDITPDKASVSDYKEFSGKGISAVVDGKRVLVGNEKLMEESNIAVKNYDGVATKLYVSIDGIFAGCIFISDEIKAESKTAIEKLKRMGIKKTVMLTGDTKDIADYVSAELSIDGYFSELLPQDKVENLKKIMGEAGKTNAKRKVAFIGDGINDAPVLAMADVGIAMGGIGSDAAIEAADVVLMTDEVDKLCTALEIAAKTKKIVTENIIMALGIKVLFLILGAFGLIGMWAAVFADVGVALLAVLNAMRMLNNKK